MPYDSLVPKSIVITGFMEIIIKCGAVNVRSFFPYLGSFSSSSQAPSFLKSFPSLSLAVEIVHFQLFSFQSFSACIQDKSLST